MVELLLPKQVTGVRFPSPAVFCVVVSPPRQPTVLPMSLSSYAVVLPFQPQAAQPGEMPSLSMHAVASTPRNALAVASTFVDTCCRRQFACPVQTAFYERARIGHAQDHIGQPYAYALGRSNHVATIPFPKRLDEEQTQLLHLRITGLVAGGADTILIDAAMLQFLDSYAAATLGTLGKLTTNSQRLAIHFFRPSPPIRKVFAIVGLDKLLGLHDSLPQALAALRQRSNRS